MIFANFTYFYLCERERNLPLPGSFPKCLQQQEQGQTTSESPELHVALPAGWQGSRMWSIIGCFQDAHSQEAEIPKEWRPKPRHINACCKHRQRLTGITKLPVQQSETLLDEAMIISHTQSIGKSLTFYLKWILSFWDAKGRLISKFQNAFGQNAFQ